ncbi:Ni/Fe-hydrogenase, b-type cytochrome subunit [Azoarcus indigens]|uniref:Ni/Fe-hydrogenase 1 B-type cytochrome subunit n=1 Tax=Azoarcus indigens TaxID=29545 RepID=A0A4R6DWG7_9RHOO|nr:Ni/Fe-hydrogenase, b-type cytochrome subunit [Azoarcus indigens]NMG65188.1 Ni/Fe-hydrogenase, b-type cytochrome subunit [Azoarcus indigens]TDN49553.1 Ni/Fe-hydrogenase 1 B-type cytochrome subunit [Azoarcus indigens]
MLAQQDAHEAERNARLVKAVYVYEAPLRLWHWVNALAITVLAITGYFIGKPLPSIAGDTSAQYVMGWIRFLHFAAAYIFAIGFLGRIYWALVGNHHARQIFILPIFNRNWWGEVLYELRWYLFLVKEPNKYVGHNPMAQLMMFLFFTVGAVYMILTGFALYGEGLGAGSWADHMFGWVIWVLGGNSLQVHNMHRLGMWVTLCFIIVHIYAAIREDIMSRQSLISTMVSGWRMFKD